MQVAGKYGTYEVRYCEHGYTGTALVLYQDKPICKWLPKFTVSEEVHRTGSQGKSPEEAKRLSAQEMERWFKHGVDDYEHIVANRTGFDEKTSKPVRTMGTYIGWAVTIIIIMLIFGFIRMLVNITSKPEPEKPVLVSEQIERYMLVEMNPPKHFYVSLKRVSDGALIEHRYVSKHCNSWSSNKVGEEFNILVKTWRYESSGETSRTMENPYSIFCN
mgnify:CR=1 FL=1